MVYFDYVDNLQAFLSLIFIQIEGYIFTYVSGFKLQDGVEAFRVLRLLSYPGFLFREIGNSRYSTTTWSPLLIGFMVQLTVHVIAFLITILFYRERKIHFFLKQICTYGYYSIAPHGIVMMATLLNGQNKYILAMRCLIQSLFMRPFHIYLHFYHTEQERKLGNIDDEESRRIYGVASILSIGILVSLVNYIWGDRIAEWIPGGIERTEQIFWTLWYLFMIAMMMVGTIRCVRRQRQKKEKKYKTVLFTGIMAAIMFATLWQYQNTMQGQRRNMGIWSGAQQYAETLLKKDKNLENDWLIGDESWRDGKNTYQVRLTYYADADAEKEGRESEYQYTIHFDEIEGYLIKSEGVPEKE